MEQLTLEQAANYKPNIPEYYIEGEPEAYTEGHKAGFIAGAEWQKEQPSPEENRTLEQAAITYKHTIIPNPILSGKTNYQLAYDSFKAGAKWQKEQVGEILNIFSRAYPEQAPLLHEIKDSLGLIKS